MGPSLAMARHFYRGDSATLFQLGISPKRALITSDSFSKASLTRWLTRRTNCGSLWAGSSGFSQRFPICVLVQVIVLRKLIPRSTCFFNELWGREVWCGCCRFGIAKVDVISQAYQSFCQPPRYRGALLALVIISAQLFVLTALAQETIRYD